MNVKHYDRGNYQATVTDETVAVAFSDGDSYVHTLEWLSSAWDAYEGEQDCDDPRIALSCSWI